MLFKEAFFFSVNEPVAFEPFLLEEVAENDHLLFKMDVVCEALVHFDVFPSYLNEAFNVKEAMLEPEESVIVHTRLDEIFFSDAMVLICEV